MMEKQPVGLYLRRGETQPPGRGGVRVLLGEETARPQGHLECGCGMSTDRCGAACGGWMLGLASVSGVARPARTVALPFQPAGLRTHASSSWLRSAAPAQCLRHSTVSIGGAQLAQYPGRLEGTLLFSLYPESPELVTSWLRPVPTVLACLPSLS